MTDKQLMNQMNAAWVFVLGGCIAIGMITHTIIGAIIVSGFTLF